MPHIKGELQKEVYHLLSTDQLQVLIWVVCMYDIYSLRQSHDTVLQNLPIL